ncbi:MAG TPA: class E sortase [Gaiellaceae bacterium]|nr:class E sortase [Gaiellaceae bacterium]
MLILAGAGTLAWAVTVWQWQDPFTAVVNRLEQRELSQALERSFDGAIPAAAAAGDAPPAELRRSLDRAAQGWRKASKRGDAVARIRIPRLGLTAVIVNGTDSETLKRGPGRYLGSAMPGEGELVYVAGHRTTYGAPFSRIDRLRKGDRVTVDLPYGTFVYEMTGHRVVPATELSVLTSKGVEQLALQACEPRFFATHRYIAYLKLVSVTSTGTSAQTSSLAAG